MPLACVVWAGSTITRNGLARLDQIIPASLSSVGGATSSELVGLHGSAMVFGWLAAACSALLGLPQAVRIIRTKSTAAISLWSWQAICWSGLAWISYGIWSERVPVVVPNLVMFSGAVTVVALISQRRGVPAVHLLGMPAAGAVLSVAMWFRQGEAAYTLVMVIPALSSRITQLLAAVKCDTLSGLSTGTLALGAAAHLLWSIYGALAGAWAIVALNVPAALLAAVTVIVALARG